MQKVKRYANKKKSQQHLERMYWGITKGDKEKFLYCAFSDSAMVKGWAVARGYVTVNGKEVELTEDTKLAVVKDRQRSKCCERKGISGLVDSFSQLPILP